MPCKRSYGIQVTVTFLWAVAITHLHSTSQLCIQYLTCPYSCIFCGIEVEDNDFKPPEADLDEYHPKATRTLFIGNLEKEVSTTELKDIFKEVGEIIVRNFTALYVIKRRNNETTVNIIYLIFV